jgi:RNase adaptor protein for sRNA GlmZ degradation
MKRELVLITGMAGSGKSIAIHALEDAGYYCVDNLPPELLLPFVQLEDQKEEAKVAIAMDVRSANALHLVPAQLAQLRAQDVHVRLLFLDATPTPWCTASPKHGATTRSRTARQRVRIRRATWWPPLNLNASC